MMRQLVEFAYQPVGALIFSHQASYSVRGLSFSAVRSGIQNIILIDTEDFVDQVAVFFQQDPALKFKGRG